MRTFELSPCPEGFGDVGSGAGATGVNGEQQHVETGTGRLDPKSTRPGDASRVSVLPTAVVLPPQHRVGQTLLVPVQQDRAGARAVGESEVAAKVAGAAEPSHTEAAKLAKRTATDTRLMNVLRGSTHRSDSNPLNCRRVDRLRPMRGCDQQLLYCNAARVIRKLNDPTND